MSPTFLCLSPEEQHAALRAARASVPAESVSDFVEAWWKAVRAYMGVYRVVGLVPGVGEVTFSSSGTSFEVIQFDGYVVRAATTRETHDIEEAIRGGWIELRVNRRIAPGADRAPLLVLYRATGVFRPFDYFRFVLPDRTGPSFQHYPYDPAQDADHHG